MTGWQKLAKDHLIPHTRLAAKWSRKGLEIYFFCGAVLGRNLCMRGRRKAKAEKG